MNHPFISLLLLLIATTAHSQSSPGQSQQTPETSAQEGAGFFKTGGWSAVFYAGNYDVADEYQFVDVRHEYAFGLGLSADLTNYSHLALDLELMDLNRDYDTPIGPPLFGAIDDDTQVNSVAMLVGGRVFYPAAELLRCYLAGGLAFYQTTMEVSGSTLGLPGTLEQTDRDTGFYYGAGAYLQWSQWRLGVDYRHFDFEGSFSKFNIHNADLGGDALLLGLGMRF